MGNESESESEYEFVSHFEKIRRISLYTMDLVKNSVKNSNTLQVIIISLGRVVWEFWIVHAQTRNRRGHTSNMRISLTFQRS